MGFWRKTKTAPVASKAPESVSSWFSTHAFDTEAQALNARDMVLRLKRPVVDGSTTGKDEWDGFGIKDLGDYQTILSGPILGWYGAQSFISHQLAAIVAQQWLVNKACSLPAHDAVRKGYNVVTENGDDLDPDSVKAIKLWDRKFHIRSQLTDFVRKGRIFGVRVAMFKVESTDKEYYEKPFNIDGVTKGSYKGIVQIDPYWTAPLLDGAAASQPDTLHFYEPTWWIINGRKVHRSHLCIYRHDNLPDILKPQYLYGGVPLPQQIMERIYAAERTANEAPELAMTKRTNVWLTDMEKVMSNSGKAIERLNLWAQFRNNYGVKLGDKEADEFQQFDTTLADFDALIMTQYQLVSAIAGVPSTKLLGTSPKGFGASGEYEESSYHEMLESIQEDALTPFLERHHALVMRSFIVPKGGESVATTVAWNPLDTPTAKELADTNLVKAQAAAQLIQSGALTAEDERKRIALDKESGYHSMGLSDIDADPDSPEDD